MQRTTARLSAVAGLAGAAVLALALPASAHVTVSADDTQRGADDAVVTFRVPNEEDHAATTKLVVTLPTATPIASVDPVPVPGWTVTTTPVTFTKPITTDDGTITTGVGTVTWTATGGGIPTGQAGLFQLLVGPLPDVPSIAFLARQTYSDGTVVQWIQPTLAGQDAPEHPAPVLMLTAATGAAPATTTPAATTPPASSASTVSASTSSGSKAKDSSARTLGIVGIALGAVGIASAGIGFRRRTT